MILSILCAKLKKKNDNYTYMEKNVTQMVFILSFITIISY